MFFPLLVLNPMPVHVSVQRFLSFLMPSLIHLILGIQLYLTNVIIVYLVLTLHQVLALLMQALAETRAQIMDKGGA